MGFFPTKGDMKLFACVFIGIIALGLFFIPMSNWWFLWDYIADTPLWTIIGQSGTILLAAGGVTVFLIIVREVLK